MRELEGRGMGFRMRESEGRGIAGSNALVDTFSGTYRGGMPWKTASIGAESLPRTSPPRGYHRPGSPPGSPPLGGKLNRMDVHTTMIVSAYSQRLQALP